MSLLAAQQEARSKLKQEMAALQEHLTQQHQVKQADLAASLAREREARIQLQQEVNDAEKLLAQQERQAPRPPVRRQLQQRQFHQAEKQSVPSDESFNVTLVKDCPEDKYGFVLRRDGTVASIAPGSIAATSQRILVGDQV